MNVQTAGLLVALALSVQEPPARYDHPVQNMAVMTVSRGEVNTLCRIAAKYRGNREILACSIHFAGGCMVVFPRGVSRDGVLFRHERAHCAGWGADHPV